MREGGQTLGYRYLVRESLPHADPHMIAACLFHSLSPHSKPAGLRGSSFFSLLLFLFLTGVMMDMALFQDWVGDVRGTATSFLNRALSFLGMISLEG